MAGYRIKVREDTSYKRLAEKRERKIEREEERERKREREREKKRERQTYRQTCRQRKCSVPYPFTSPEDTRLTVKNRSCLMQSLE